MAESQLAFEYPAPAESALRASLTDARLRRYLVKGGFNFAYAMRWYLWNARISKAFHYPLHVMEVTLRNAVVHHLQLCGAPDGWPFDTAFIETLNKASPGIRESLNVAKTNILRARLSADHFHSLRLDRHLDIPRFGTLEADDVIANVSLDFWVRLLGPDFETAWQPHLHRVFPNLQDRSRRDVWKTARHLRDFRNRVAHYRPVFHLADLRETHAAILDTIRLRCPETARWAQHFSTVPKVLAQEPTPNAPSGDEIVPLLRPVAVVPDADVALSEVLPLFAGGKEWVVTARAGHYVAIGCADVVRWLAPSAADGIVELDVSLEAVIDGTVSRRRAAPIAVDSTPGMAATMFYARNVPTKEKPSALVATTDGTMGSEVVGILLKEDLKRQ